jgi:hypothetical protein
MTLRIITLRIMTLRVMTLRIMTLSITALTRNNDTQNNDTRYMTLSIKNNNLEANQHINTQHTSKFSMTILNTLHSVYVAQH